jgi:hypothetical protein
VTFDETNGCGIKEEGKDSMEQVHEEEVAEEEEEEEKEQQDIRVPPKTPRKRIQKNHPSGMIIRNKDVEFETRRRIFSPKQLRQHYYQQLSQAVLKKPTRMNSG